MHPISWPRQLMEVHFYMAKLTREKKKEMFLGKEYIFRSLNELEVAIHEYIEYYYKRISLKLKGLTPVQYRNQSYMV